MYTALDGAQLVRHGPRSTLVTRKGVRRERAPLSPRSSCRTRPREAGSTPGVCRGASTSAESAAAASRGSWLCARREGHRGARSARARLRRALRLLSITATCARRVASSAALRLRLGWSRRRGWLRPASAASPQPPHVVDDRPHDCPTRSEHCARRGHRVRPLWLLAARGSAHNSVGSCENSV